MSEAWRTKKDIIKDLKFATGSYNDELNEEYVVWGEQPPPRLVMPDEGDEMLRICGGVGPGDVSTSNEVCEPDLAGITQMLRMVEQFNESSSNESNNDTQSKTATNTLISISKLNPNVPAFEPKNIDTVVLNKLSEVDKNCVATTSVKAKEIDEVKQFNIAKNVDDMKIMNKADNVITDFSRVDTSRLTDAEVQEMRAKVKEKIRVTSNEKCGKLKRERNLAIATLVKLHCASQTNDLNTPKLISPEYFEQRLSDQKEKLSDSEVPGNVSYLDIALNNPDNATDSSVVYKRCEPLVDKNTAESNEMVNEETEYRTEISNSSIARNLQSKETLPTTTSNNETNKEVKQSIEKVENWLNSPQKVPKAPPLYLGPVTFKRKAKSSNSKPESPISTISDNTSTVINTVEEFIPSEYASQLNKEYVERSKAKQKVEQDIWTKLEAQLIEKDEILKKLAQKPSSSYTTE
ncbi:uncharacterized protein LOC123656999 [Melitaea cinxia]|uniref:uncharacterized protein LOC123656999 n=1 Tax=Melitaea cinxia TaxID=113334 RepID=UPI001E26F5BA|nr:uncharacterized protein LOC123656999 [Melitaea cinxia]